VRIRVDIVGSLPRLMAAEILAGETAVTRAVDQAGTRLQKEWRGQVTGAGLGARLARTIRRELYPSRDVSLNAASLVYARPNAGGGASAATVIGAHDEGPLIRGRDGLWLAIPIGEVARMRGANNKRITPLGWEQRTNRALTFIFRPGRPGLLVDTGRPLLRRVNDAVGFRQSAPRTRKDIWIPIFILVPQTRLRKRLNVEKLAREAEATLPGLVVANWKDPN